MRAIVITGYGGVEHLEVRDVPEPKVASADLKIRLAATSINPVDWKIRRGDLKQYMPVQLPFIPGWDSSGEVVEVGTAVKSFQVGDRVMGSVERSYAERVVASVDAWARVPSSLDLRDAAALPLIGLTGVQLMEEAVRPQAGQIVLVTGAVGAVGRAAVFAGKAMGARIWAGVRGRQKKEAEALGVEGVVAIDDEAEWQRIPELDALADTVGGATTGKLLSKVKHGGIVASVVGEPPGAKERGFEVRAIRTRRDSARLAKLGESAARGELVIPVAKRFSFDQVREAHRFAESGSVGKVLLLP
jgi:NADPH:quinone reductase-like Zn-dependent oxidoreductase